MKNKFEIYMGAHCIGWANIEREGLYYRVCCRCSIKEKSFFRVVATCANGKHPLGILVPTASGFTLTARIPIRKVDLNTVCFSVEPQDSCERIIRIPISSDMVLPWLSQLEYTRLHDQNGLKMLIMKQNEA